MGLVTNVKDVEKLATKKEKENWRFRTFLKGCDLEVKQLDAIVHRLNDMVSAKIDCQSCGNCCRVMSPVLNPKDIKRLAAHLSMPPGEFEKEYLVKDDEGEGLTFRSEPCPFLSGNFCTVYSARPENCRSYPHLHKKDFVFRLIGVVNNCSCCPIVYNVYELLKDELQSLEWDSDFDDYE